MDYIEIFMEYEFPLFSADAVKIGHQRELVSI